MLSPEGFFSCFGDEILGNLKDFSLALVMKYLVTMVYLGMLFGIGKENMHIVSFLSCSMVVIG